MKKFRTMQLINPNVTLRSNYPERYIVVDKMLKGVYYIDSRTKVQGHHKSRWEGELSPLSSTKKTLSYDEAEQLYPELFL